MPDIELEDGEEQCGDDALIDGHQFTCSRIAFHPGDHLDAVADVSWEPEHG